MQEVTYEESIYNLNDNMSAMGMADNYSQGMGSAMGGQKEESLAGLLATGQNNVANSDTKS